MEIIEVKLDDILPYTRNQKKHDKKQVDNVAESIKQFGYVQPIVIDKDNNIIIGHCRALASKKLKLDTVPCVKLEDLTSEEANKLRLLDNKLNESEWDIDLLVEDIPQLDFSGFDLNWNIKIENEEEEKTENTSVTNFNYQEQYGVIVMCKNELEQEQIYNRLSDEGFECKVVAT